MINSRGDDLRCSKWNCLKCEGTFVSLVKTENSFICGRRCMLFFCVKVVLSYCRRELVWQLTSKSEMLLWYQRQVSFWYSMHEVIRTSSTKFFLHFELLHILTLQIHFGRKLYLHVEKKKELFLWTRVSSSTCSLKSLASASMLARLEKR